MDSVIEVKVPDIGGYKNIPIIEVLVKPGDSINVEDTLITLESDKATLDVPAPAAGIIKELKIKTGDKVSEGTLLLTLEPANQAPAPAKIAKETVQQPPAAATSAKTTTPTPAELPPPPPPPSTTSEPVNEVTFTAAHASPSVRRFARELGVNLNEVKGSGPKNRILQEDVKAYVKSEFTAPRNAASSGDVGLGIIPWPQVDFAKFGPVESKPLSRIKKISGANLHRNWVMIPHVTNHEDADITELEAFRVQVNKELEKSGAKLTLLAFLVKAACMALKQFPEFNASLDGENLILKKYYHIGFAADTPNGLVVPVIKDADQKGVVAIAKEMSELAAKAREGKLAPAEMQGSCFSISSLGGIGGTYFTPIINAPEVAILGVCKSTMKPVWDGKQFVPRLILPLSLSWDHRVLDGATAARFNTYFASLLSDMRRAML